VEHEHLPQAPAATAAHRAMPIDRGPTRSAIRRRAARLARAPIALEAAVTLAWSTIGVKALGPRRLMRLIGAVDRAGAALDNVRAPASDRAAAVRARRVGGIVERLAQVLPWHPVCLPQAIAVRAMLRRRGIDSTLHLGIASLEPLSAHAWVTVGEAVVQGGSIRSVTKVARFR
jgi:hypothetical protein